jgi:hypothetical protein
MLKAASSSMTPNCTQPAEMRCEPAQLAQMPLLLQHCGLPLLHCGAGGARRAARERSGGGGARGRARRGRRAAGAAERGPQRPHKATARDRAYRALRQREHQPLGAAGVARQRLAKGELRRQHLRALRARPSRVSRGQCGCRTGGTPAVGELESTRRGDARGRQAHAVVLAAHAVRPPAREVDAGAGEGVLPRVGCARAGAVVH